MLMFFLSIFKTSFSIQRNLFQYSDLVPAIYQITNNLIEGVHHLNSTAIKTLVTFEQEITRDFNPYILFYKTCNYFLNPTSL